MPDSIIVYRNPAEAAFWEGGYFIPLVCGLGVGMAVFLVLVSLAKMLDTNSRHEDSIMTIGGVVAIIAGLYTTSKLLI